MRSVNSTEATVFTVFNFRPGIARTDRKRCVCCSRVATNFVTNRTTDADPASNVRGVGAVSVIFGSPVSLRVHYCETEEVSFTTLLRQNNEQHNGLLSRMLFSDLYKNYSSFRTF